MEDIMEKEELLLNIAETRNSIEKLQNIHGRLNALYKPPIKFGCLGHIISFIVYWVVVSLAMGWVMDIVLFPVNIMLSDDILEKVGEIGAVIIVIVVAISYPYIFNLINKNRNKKNAEISMSQEVKRMEMEKQNIIEYIETNSVIPADYRYIGALNTFEKYLINQRADNLKECINLFEQEMRHEEQMNELRNLKQIQEATYQKANEATTISWISLFTRR